MRIRAFLLCLAVTLLCGCGAGQSTGTEAGGQLAPLELKTTTATGVFAFGDPGASQGRVAGTVWLDGPTPATVRLFEKDGEQRLEATLADGTVLLADLSQPHVDTLVLQGTDLHGPYETGHWVWVTPVSTLLAVYRDLRPDLSGTDRMVRLKSFLRLSADQSVNRPFSSVPQSQFSPRAFREAAGGQSLLHFARSLIQELEAGKPRGFLTLGIWDDPEEVPPATGPSFLASFMTNVGAGLVTDIVWKSLGFGMAKLFGSTSTSKQLTAISNQLTDVQNQLDGIEKALAGLGTGTLASQISSNDISKLFTYQTQEQTVLTNAQTNFQPFTFNNAGFLASSDVALLTSPNNAGAALGYAQGIQGACLNITPSAGQGNIIAGFTESQATSYGSGASTFPSGNNTTFYYDFRNDVSVTGDLQGASDYYLGYLGHAGNMLCESVTQALGTNVAVPAAAVQQAQSYLNGSGYNQVLLGDSSQNGLLALARRMQQQRPLALLGGGSPLGSVWGAPAVNETIAGTGNVNGTFWASCVEITSVDTDKGTGGIFIDQIGMFTVNNEFNWFLPSKAEVVSLVQSARNAAIADQITNSAEQVPYGLHKLGLLSDANYKTGMKNVGIYFQLTVSGNNPACQVYETQDGSTDSGLKELGLNAYGFNPSSDNPRLVLLVRPFPGQPQGAGGKSKNATATGVASTSGPAAVMSSKSAQQVTASGNQLYMWNTGQALAGQFPPSEIVVARDQGSNQVRAYGIWVVGWPVVPSAYLDTNQTFCNLYKYYPDLGPTPSQYLIYTELTGMVEWLSSDTTAVEVSNYALTNLSTYGGTATNAYLTGGDLLIEDPVLTKTTTPVPATNVTGGTVLLARLGDSPAGVDPVLTGATSAAFGTPLGTLDATGATLTGGTITRGVVASDDGLTVYTLTDAGGTTRTLAAGGTIRNATIENGFVTLATGSSTAGGVLTAHTTATGATITASWLISPSTSTLTNTLPSTAQVVTGTLSLPAGSVTPQPAHRSLVVSPNFTQVSLKAGGSTMVFYTTAFNIDGTCQDLSVLPGTQYTIFQQVGNDQTFQEIPAALASFGGVDAGGKPVQPNVLQFHAGFNNYSGELIIRATNGSNSGYSFIQVLAPP